MSADSALVFVPLALACCCACGGAFARAGCNSVLEDFVGCAELAGDRSSSESDLTQQLRNDKSPPFFRFACGAESEALPG